MFTPFHVAYHAIDLDAARRFDGGVLGCREGRSTETWVDFDVFGHRISPHLGEPFATTRTGKVGNHMVMMPPLGVVLPLDVSVEGLQNQPGSNPPSSAAQANLCMRRKRTCTDTRRDECRLRPLCRAWRAATSCLRHHRRSDDAPR